MKKRLFGAAAIVILTAYVSNLSAQSLVMSQNFEDESFPPQGWIALDNDGDGHGWQRQTGSNIVTQYTGSKGMAISFTRDASSYTSYNEQDNWLITPSFEVTNDQFVMQFVYAAQDLDNTEPISLLVSEGGATPADFNEIWKSTADNGYDDNIIWSTCKRSLSEYKGKTIRLAIRHAAEGTYGLSIDDFYIFNQNGPMQPSNFSVKAATDGKKEVTLSWTNPVKSANGNDLTDLTIVVYRDGEKVTELTGRTPGEDDSYVDTTENGTHVYTIAAKNMEGEGKKVSSKSVYLGEDIAKPITDVTALTMPDGTVSITWVAPTKGVNNGFINTETMTYTVYRGSEAIATGIKTNYHVDATPAKGINAYTVTTVTGGGESGVDSYTSAYVSGESSDVDVMIAQTAQRDNSLDRLGFDVYSSYSVNQNIYYSSDFNFITGEIKDIVFKAYRGAESQLTFKGRIYISHTELSQLDDWAPVADADKVFEGEVTLNQGSNDVMLHLTKPFDYKGGNIVVTWIKDGAPSGSYSDRFYSIITDHEKRTFSTSTYSAVDITSLPHSTYSDKQTNQIPSTRFILSPKGVTSLSGKVTYGADKVAVEGACVSVDGFDGLVAETDAEGKYSFKYVPVKATSLKVTKAGYKDGSATVTLTEGTAAIADFNLERYANFTLSGKVTAEDTGLNAMGAVVTLGGYEEASATVGEDGKWSIPGVYVGKDYTIAVKYPLYEVYTSTFNYAEEGDKEFEAIVLDRAVISPWNVNVKVAEDGSAANLTWNDPASRDVKAGIKSIGDVSTMKYTGGDYYSNVYNVAHFFTEDDITAQKMAGLVVDGVRVYIKATEGKFTAKVWRGTRGDNIEVASQPIPASAISADGGWVSVTFDNPAEIKPGYSYLIGVEADNASKSPFGEADSKYIEGGNNVKWGESASSGNGFSAWCIQAECRVPGTDVEISANDDVPECSYNVYRGVKGDDGKTEWSALTTTPVSELSYSDASWSTQNSGEYVYGVTAVYNKVGESSKALSDCLKRAVDTDIAVSAFVTPVKSTEIQNKVNVEVEITNFGELPVAEVPVTLTINGNKALEGKYTSELKKGEKATLKLGEITLVEGLNTLVATSSVEGDKVQANDVLTFEIPNFENIKLCGYRWDAYGNAGFMDIDSNNPEAADFKVEVTPDDALIIAGEAVNGTYYGYTATWWGESREFVEINPSNWVVSRTVECTDYYVVDMAYDYSSDAMYCIGVDGVGTSYLGTVDLSTGVVTPVKAFDVIMRAIACNLDGQLYAVDSEGKFYTVDSATAAATYVGDTATGSAQYLQSMTFDHNSGRLFWAHTNAAISGELYEIDPATAKSTRMGTVMFKGFNPSEIVGMYVPYEAPAKSFKAESVTPADKEKMVEFDGVTIEWPSAVNVDVNKLAATTFTVDVKKWISEGDGTSTVTVRPADANGAAVKVAFEEGKSYTLIIPEGAFVMPNGDYSEALTLVYISSVSGVAGIESDEDTRYYDLNGFEVKNPEPGHFYIVRHGNAPAVKEMVGK